MDNEFLSRLRLAEAGHMRCFPRVVVIGVGGVNFVEFLRLAQFCDRALTGKHRFHGILVYCGTENRTHCSYPSIYFLSIFCF